MDRDRIEIKRLILDRRIMRRYFIPILIAPVLVSALLLGCNSVPTSEPASSQESGLPTESVSSEYQQQINELEQQMQSLTQQVDSLEKSISSLERELETLPDSNSSDFEARIEQQIAQLGQQIDELGEQLDGLNTEIVAVKQQSAEQGAEEETTSSPSVPEAPPGTIFTFSGQGNSQSLPFNIRSSPWKFQWWADVGKGQVFFKFFIRDPAKPGSDDYSSDVTRYYWGIMEPGTTARETISYVPSGTYYIKVEVDSSATWTIWVVEL